MPLRPRPVLAACFLVAVAVHTGWVGTIAGQEDWDAVYYGQVARNIADGAGAVSDSLWTLTYLPDELPAPADTYWLPLPSRVLVPGRLLAGDAGAEATAVVLAACWAPLAAALARTIGASRRTTLAAGLLAATGGAWSRLATTTDTFGVFGVVGAVGMLGVARRNPPVVAVASAAAVLTRSDGVLLAIAFSVGLWRRERGRAAVAPLAGAAIGLLGWTARTAVVAGAEALDARSVALRTDDYLDVFDGVVHAPATPLDRLSAVVAEAPAFAGWWIGLGLGVGAPALAIAAWRHRAEPWVRGLVTFALLAPPLLVLAAPAVGRHGSTTRMLAAAAPGAAALVAVGAEQIGERLARWRRYDANVVAILVVAACAVIAVGIGLRRSSVGEPVGAPCDAVRAAGVEPSEPIFTSDAIPTSERCRQVTVMITRTVDPRRAACIADRYGIRFAVTSPGGDEGQLRDVDVPTVLPTWTPVDDRLWARPDGERGRGCET